MDLNKYIEEEFKKIDDEVNKDKDIREKAAYIYEQLKVHPVYRETVNGVEYELAMKMKGNKIVLIARNVAKAKIMGNKLIPYMFSADYDPEISIEDTYKTIISTFIAHVSGRLAIETDDGVSFV